MAGRRTRAGARFGPQLIRQTDYLPHDGVPAVAGAPGRRLARPAVCTTPATSRCFPATPRGRLPATCRPRSTRSRATAPSRSSSAATTRSPGRTRRAWPSDLGQGRISMIHFDAHADTGNIEFGSLIGHGQPMRRLIESGAVRGDRFLQIRPARLLAASGRRSTGWPSSGCVPTR